MSDGVVNIVGVGNTLMGDDGVGPAVIERLARCRLPDCARLHDAGLAVSDVLGTLDPADPLIVVDCLRGGGEPGAVYRPTLPALADAGGPATGCTSLHELSVVPALRLEALAGREFRDVTFFGIEPQALAWGEGLSAAVSESADVLVDVLRQEIRTRAGRQAAPSPCEAAGDRQS